MSDHLSKFKGATQVVRLLHTELVGCVQGADEAASRHPEDQAAGVPRQRVG